MKKEGKYGEPLKTLYLKRNVLSVEQEIEVKDEDGKIVYQSQSKVSLLDKTDITDGQGNPVAHFEKRRLSIIERHVLTMESGLEVVLEKDPMHLIKEITNVNGMNWQLRGNVQRLNFEVVGPEEEVIAVVSQKVFKKEDTYQVAIYRQEDVDLIACITIILIHIIRDRNLKNSKKIVKPSVGGSMIKPK